MTLRLDRRTFARTVLGAVTCGVLALSGAAARAADVKEIRLDWATYNPVSLVLKEKGFLEEALKPQGIKVRWTQSLGSNKALEFLNGGAIDFGSSAGGPPLLARIKGKPNKGVFAHLRPEREAPVTPKENGHPQGPHPQGQRNAG